MIRGVDVCSIQDGARNVVDWPALAKIGIRFGYRQCTRSIDMRDPHFDNDVAAMRAASIAPGAYHFESPVPGHDPEVQALFAFDKSGGLGAHDGELPPMVDIEWPPPEEWSKHGCTAASIRDHLITRLRAATRLCQRKPVVYTYPYFWHNVLAAGGCDELASYPLCIADYNRWSGKVPPDGARPTSLAPWLSATFWQHDGNGGLRMPNGGDADFDVFLGSEDDFRALLTPSAAIAEEMRALLTQPPTLAPDTEPAPPPSAA